MNRTTKILAAIALAAPAPLIAQASSYTPGTVRPVSSIKVEPDLLLAVEYKDYIPLAQQLDMQKKFEAMMATDAHKTETASGERTKMRTQLSSMELQELKPK